MLIKSNSTNWRRRIPKKFSHCCKGSKPHVRLPSLGIRQRAWECPGNFTGKPKGLNYKTSGGLGGEGDPVLEGTNKTLSAPRLRGKEQ